MALKRAHRGVVIQGPNEAAAIHLVVGEMRAKRSDACIAEFNGERDIFGLVIIKIRWV